MFLLRVSPIAVPVLMLAACAGHPETRTADATPPGCVREVRTGSNFPVLNCAGAQGAADQERATEQVRTDIRRQPARGTAGP
jgi:hypothetical protein